MNYDHMASMKSCKAMQPCRDFDDHTLRLTMPLAQPGTLLLPIFKGIGNHEPTVVRTNYKFAPQRDLEAALDLEESDSRELLSFVKIVAIGRTVAEKLEFS